MAHTFLNSLRIPPVTSTTVTSGNISGSFSTADGATVVAAMIMYAGTAARGGGTPTFGGTNMTQADTQRYGLTSGECSVELWYIVSPPTAGSYLINVPNSGSLATNVDIASAKAQNGYTSVLDVASGSSNSGATTNPYITFTTSGSGDMIFVGSANGAQNYAPTAYTGTELFHRDNGAWGEASQYYVKSTSGPQTMTFTFGTGEDWGVVAVALKEQYVPTTHDGAANLSPQSEITSAAKLIINGASTLLATSEITVLGIKYIKETGNLNASSQITPEGSKIQQAYASLVTLSEVISVGKKTINGAADFSLQSETTITSKIILGGYCEITTTSMLTAEGIKYLNGQSGLLPNSEMVSIGSRYLTGTSTFLATSLLIAIAAAGGLLVRTSGVHAGINRFVNNVGRTN